LSQKGKGYISVVIQSSNKKGDESNGGGRSINEGIETAMPENPWSHAGVFSHPVIPSGSVSHEANRVSNIGSQARNLI